MRTKWGSCNTDNKNIMFNIELAKKPLRCIEYVVVHELIHLIDRKHGDVFQTLMNQYLPNWVQLRDELNREIGKR
jgi:predicted metal-dependent hydrolase